MLATEAAKVHRKHDDSLTSYFAVDWNATPVRFNENMQIIDIADCMGIIYGSEASAKVAQSKFFAAGALARTAEILGCNKDSILYKVKWQDSARMRLAIRIPHMQKLLAMKMTTMPHASKLATILDVDTLTVANANAHCQQKDAPEEVTAEGSVTTLSLTRADVFKAADARMVMQSANRWLVATDTESEFRRMKATVDKELESVRYQEEVYKSQTRCKSAVVAAEVANLEVKIAAAERLGMQQEAGALKRKLVDL